VLLSQLQNSFCDPSVASTAPNSAPKIRGNSVFPNGSLKRDPGPLRDLLAHMGPRLRDHTRKRKMRDIWGRLIFARFFQPAPNVSLPDFTPPWVPFRSLFLVKGPFFFKKCRETRYLSREMLTVLFPPISHNSPA